MGFGGHISTVRRYSCGDEVVYEASLSRWQIVLISDYVADDTRTPGPVMFDSVNCISTIRLLASLPVVDGIGMCERARSPCRKKIISSKAVLTCKCVQFVGFNFSMYTYSALKTSATPSSPAVTTAAPPPPCAKPKIPPPSPPPR